MRTSIGRGSTCSLVGNTIEILTLILAVFMSSNTVTGKEDTRDWQEKITAIKWVAYTPPSGNPNRKIEATPDAIREDLVMLRKAEFTGLVTYGSSGVMGTEFPQIAQDTGFKGLILGVWDPNNRQEIAAANVAARNPIVMGICVGNEGLPEKGQAKGRYTLEQLSSVIQDLQKSTGKFVTTAEQFGDYSDERLLKLGDWVFPTVHPYFYRVREPLDAVKWTKDAYDKLKKSGRFVFFKEVGLPTAGDEEGKMSEVAQEQYYTGLAKTDVRFVYFEGFDQPWKTYLPIEPHWGLFTSTRTPKLFAQRFIPSPAMFNVYTDLDSPENHFKPIGYMGDMGDIHMEETWDQNPHSGQTCIRVIYDAKGKGPYSGISYPPPAKWSGVYWLDGDWGKDEVSKGRGFNLSLYSRVKFWARAEKDCRIEFKVAGINEKYGDSLKDARSKTAKLITKWTEYEIDLRNADLSHIIGGFCWASNWNSNPEGVTFYLDDIRFEK